MPEGAGTTPEPAFCDLLDLASERVGGAALIADDDFFAPKENLLRPGRPQWIEGKYTDRGKWMDGWETRRSRVLGNHDWCVIRLGLPGIVRGLDIDTSFFRGNFPESASVEGASVEGHPAPPDLVAKGVEWIEVLPRSPLRGHAQNFFAVACPYRLTHVRLTIHPDGGVARFRVHGEPVQDLRRVAARAGGLVDLAAAENGAGVIACNDMFFGSRQNLILPGRSANMGDGWETRRKRGLTGGENDWVVVRLACEGSVRGVEVDTNWFKGNYPESASLEGTRAEDGEPLAALVDERRGGWQELLPRSKLRAHTRHFFEDELVAPAGPFTHVRFRIYPDGGVSRLRLLGTPSPGGFARAALRRLDALVPAEAAIELERCCGSRRFAEAMARARPFGSEAALLSRADLVLRDLGRDDWLEAFAAHPRIGSRRDVDGKQGVERRWAEGEQAGARGAAEATLEALASLNREYEARFGWIYIVCATGRTADEMLALLRQRLANDPETEIRAAAAEQAAITRIRLEKMLRP